MYACIGELLAWCTMLYCVNWSRQLFTTAPPVVNMVMGRVIITTIIIISIITHNASLLVYLNFIFIRTCHHHCSW